MHTTATIRRRRRRCAVDAASDGPQAPLLDHIRCPRFLSLVTHILPHGWCSQYGVMPRTSFLLFALFTTHCCAAKQIAQDAAQDAVFPFGDRKLHTTARTSNSSWGRGPSPTRQDANCTKAGVWPAMRCIAHGGGRRCDEPGCDKIALGYKGTASSPGVPRRRGARAGGASPTGAASAARSRAATRVPRGARESATLTGAAGKLICRDSRPVTFTAHQRLSHACA